MSKPVALDICCRMGGATVGLQRAGFYVIGFDIAPQPGYPGDDFYQEDGLQVLEEMIECPGVWPSPDLIWQSWPCQEGSAPNNGTNKGKKEHPQFIPQARELSDRIGIPYVIEQPADCRPGLIRKDLVLCMDMFKGDLEPPWVQKHRAFEINGWPAPTAPEHPKHQGYVRGWRGRAGDRPGFFRDGPYVAGYGKGGGKGTTVELAHAMGINWMQRKARDEDNRFDLCEAIPPAYAEFIGRSFLDAH